ncbi:hypothetical protein [Synechococcus lacustris]|nr:hypothetical protein [Synechococcus lacustris]
MGADAAKLFVAHDSHPFFVFQCNLQQTFWKAKYFWGADLGKNI